jgi:hypothetical protein
MPVSDKRSSLPRCSVGDKEEKMFCTAVSRSLHKELAALPTSEWNVSYSESSTIAKLGEGKKTIPAIWSNSGF